VNDAKYEIKVFYVQYDTSFLVTEISLDNVTSDEEAVKECKRHRDTYYKMLFKNQYESMPNTEVKLLLVKRSGDDLPITIGYTEIIKRYSGIPEKASSEFEYDRVQSFYRDYRN
jgi:hypothetical protein